MSEADDNATRNSPPCLGGVDAALGGRGGRPDRIHNIPYLQTFRTELRKSLTPAEATLWKALQRSKLDGRKFRRQHGVGNYILDFFCVYERLGIELDGQVHFNDAARIYDHERKLFLNHFGIKIVRFENYLVFQEMEYVLFHIRNSFGWWNNEDSCRTTTPSAEAAATPPKQGGEF